jgi:hypothetical protein
MRKILTLIVPAFALLAGGVAAVSTLTAAPALAEPDSNGGSGC